MVTLSNKCELTASVSGMEGKAILSGENLIFLNDTEKTVDIVRGTEDQKKLYNFAISNNGENFGPVLNQFTDKIYSRFYADINIPEDKLLLEANKWELSHGGLSGRTAQQFIDYLLGQMD